MSYDRQYSELQIIEVTGLNNVSNKTIFQTTFAILFEKRNEEMSSVINSLIRIIRSYTSYGPIKPITDTQRSYIVWLQIVLIQSNRYSCLHEYLGPI